MDQRKFPGKNNRRKGRAGRNLTGATPLRTEAMLAEAQRIFHVGSWDWDLATDRLEFSEEMFRLFGMLPGEVEVTREVFVKFLHPDEAEQMLLEFHHSASHPFSSIEHRIVLRNGTTRIAHTRVKAYKDENGKPLRLLGTTQDVTERRHTEEALKQSEWRNRVVSELITDYIFVVDVEPDRTIKLRWASENLFQMTGRTSANAVIYEVWRKMIHPDDAAASLAFIKRILSTNEPGEIECRMLSERDGERWVRVFARPLVDSANKVISIVGAIQDITDRRRAEEALRVTEADYRAIFEGAPVGIFRSTVDGRLIKANQTMATMYGYGTSEEMIVGIQSIAEQMYTDAKIRREFVRQIVKHGEILGFESLDRRKDGSTVWISTNARAVKNTAGEILYFEGFVTDITGRKQSEADLQKANEQLRIQLDEIGKLQVTLREQATHDQLTGLYNRHYIQEEITREYARALRNGYPISIIVLDLDHLKETNQKYGHFTGGDIALQALGEHLKTMTRAEDIACRYGGDEFLVVLHNTLARVAHERAEQWRKSLTQMEIDSKGAKFNISFSAGVASFPANGQSIEEVMQAADKALYRAKAMGRNCVVTYSE